MAAKQNPAPSVGGGRGSIFVNAGAPDDPKHTSARIPSQPQLPSGFDPMAMPIIAAHFFDVTTDDQRTA